MAVNPLQDGECEAISLLAASNPQAFHIMTEYFERMLEKEKESCVDCNLANVEIHRGMARAWRLAANVHVDAMNRLNG
jgi:hypothetical protein